MRQMRRFCRFKIDLKKSFQPARDAVVDVDHEEDRLPVSDLSEAVSLNRFFRFFRLIRLIHFIGLFPVNLR